MSEKMLTDDQMAEILASAQALTNMPPEERRAAELLKELLGGSTPRAIPAARRGCTTSTCSSMTGEPSR